MKKESPAAPNDQEPDAMMKNADESGELSEAELESVAGGCLELDDGTTYGSGCS